MKIIGIEHIGIAVKNIREASPFRDHVLQIGHSTTEDVDDQGVITAIYDREWLNFFRQNILILQSLSF